MSVPKDSFRILVIGGGPAGLLIAQALKKIGISSTVFEQDASPIARPRDWNFGIYWAMVPLDECLPEELQSQINNVQVDSRTPAADDIMPIYNGQTGELMKKVPAPYSLRLQRRKFLELISTGIDIRFGKRIASVKSDGTTATATFEDGTSESGNLLIGAEGAHSKVREYLLGPEESALIMSPLVASATMAVPPAETALKLQEIHPRYSIIFHPHGYFSWIGVHDAYNGTNPGEWTYMILQSWKSDENYTPVSGPEILADIKERATEYGEPFNSFFQSIPDGTRCWHNRLSYWPTKPWDNHNGTLTLIGDAAHPMTFHRGQGLNNAIHDAAGFARELKGVDLTSHSAVTAALTAYEQEVWERGKEAVLMSNENSLAIHDWSTLLRSPLFRAGLKQKVEAEVEQEKENGA